MILSVSTYIFLVNLEKNIYPGTSLSEGDWLFRGFAVFCCLMHSHILVCKSGPSCSKLMMSLVNILLKVWSLNIWGWSGGAKVSCILCHRGVQLILAYSWARPAILVVGKGRGGMFLFLLFLPFHSCSSFFPVPLFHLFYYPFFLFSPFLWETTQNDAQGLTCR